MHSILLVDDHEIIIDGLKAMLHNEKDIIILGEAYNGNQAIEKVKQLKPDIVIMDISMPELTGIEATKIIAKDYPNVKIIILTQHESKEYIIQILNAGAHGYLLKNSPKSELLLAISKVVKNEKYVGNKASSLLINDLLKPTNTEAQNNAPEVILTKREIEIIKLIANDNSNQEISDLLNISLRTVETHRRNVMQKINVNSVVALVHYAVKHKIISI